MGYIYKLTDITNNKIYIGQTKKSLDSRLKQHRNDFNKASSKNSRLYSAMRDHGVGSFIMESLGEFSDDILNDKEIEFINKYNSTNPDIGYNCALGGSGRKTITIDPLILKDMFVDKFMTMKLIAETLHISTDSVSNLIRTTMSRDEIRKISIRNRTRLSVRGISMYNSDNELIQRFRSVMDAAKYISEYIDLNGKSKVPKTIMDELSRHCNGSRKGNFLYGYYWYY